MKMFHLVILIFIPTLSFSMHTKQKIKEEFDESNFNKMLENQQKSNNDLLKELAVIDIAVIDIKDPQSVKKLQDIKRHLLTKKRS